MSPLGPARRSRAARASSALPPSASCCVERESYFPNSASNAETTSANGFPVVSRTCLTVNCDSLIIPSLHSEPQLAPHDQDHHKAVPNQASGHQGEKR